jgi:hypothetical protein
MLAMGVGVEDGAGGRIYGKEGKTYSCPVVEAATVKIAQSKVKLMVSFILRSLRGH